MHFFTLFNGSPLKKKKLTITSFIAATMLLFAQEWWDLRMPAVPFILILSIPLWILPKASALRYTFFTTPFLMGVHGAYSLLIYVCLLCRVKVTNKYQYVFPIILFMVEVLDCFFFSDIGEYSTKILLYSSCLGILYFAFFLENADYADLLKYFCWGLGLSLLLLYGRLMLHGTMDEILAVTNRDGLEEKISGNDGINHFIANANSIGYYSIMLISALICVGKKLKFHMVEIALLLLIAIVAGGVSYSRTWLVCLAILTATYFVVSNMKEKVYFTVLITCAMIYVINTDNGFIASLTAGFESRFEEENIITGGNRSTIFNRYNDFFFSHPSYWVTGTGTTCVHNVANNEVSIHNGTQQIYVCTGLIGTIVLLITALKLKASNEYRRKELTQWIPLLISILFLQTVQFLSPYFLMFPILAGVYALRLNENTQAYEK